MMTAALPDGREQRGGRPASVARADAAFELWGPVLAAGSSMPRRGATRMAGGFLHVAG